MFFYFSKAAWVLLQPLNFLIVLFGLALLIGRAGKNSVATWLARLIFAAFVLTGFTQLADALLDRLEQQYPVPIISEPPFGIIVLGGGVVADDYNAPLPYQLRESGDRVIAGLALKRKYPDAKLLYTGGAAVIIGKGTPETDAVRALYRDLYGSELGGLFEDQSRTTSENAILTARMIGGEREKNWLLVTSAFHMTRAVASFRRVGIRITPYPTDYISRPLQFPWISVNASRNFRKLSIVTKEILGLTAYWLTYR